MLIKLSRSEPQINKMDVELLEGQLSVQLPDFFKQFFLKNNGGVPDKDWWDSGDDYEPIRVKRFKAIARVAATDSLDTKYIWSCYQAMTARKVIPATILPFATDDGGNFFCLDLVEGGVCYFATDSYDADLTIAENHLNSYRWLAGSFDDFVSGLKDETEIDL
ncbi:SMI1/KNR4 family protein [Pseudomonas sp. KCA11]|uniref:SMI1/KNR4 family protein n=1 Tax=Pseudomonas sp. KCA11 TaxID=2899114 RepID=UPI001F43326E|nr:SMI1/KNR4 family protein [Pseudomonas sp. KCA11]MCE5995362.1 SMI1/KNR4 family protein [Pseudomonas sp. KCA11]